MIRFQPSIRGKVIFAYYIGIVIVLVIALVTYLNLMKISKKVTFSFTISELFDTTLEIRRFEKNYFLYGHAEDYSENLRFAEKAENILSRNKEIIRKLSISKSVYVLERDISEYKSLMQRYFQLRKGNFSMEAKVLEDKIREKGKEIADTAEAISIAERKYIESLINTSRKILIVSGGLLMIVAFFIGQYLSRMVIRPLKQLEKNMQNITEGRFDAISMHSSEREIISLSNAFDRMLKEIEIRQMSYIAQSNKLASLGTMVSGVAHQLNNPLSNISTSCQILQEEIEDADIVYKKELLQQIEKEVERAKAMVHSLLQFSKKKETKMEALPVKMLIDDTIKLLKGNIPAKVEVTVDIPDDLWVIADRQKMEHSLLNILKNSIDAIHDEGKVTISAKEDKNENTVEIKIQDTGFGIEPENIGRIFEPFFSTKEKGTGLGLFIANEFIKTQGGSLEVDSIVGKGTTFLIRLPAKEG